MQIQSIGVLLFRSNKDKEPKLILRTAKDVQNWMKSKDPILVYDDKIDYELPKNKYKTKKKPEISRFQAFRIIPDKYQQPMPNNVPSW